MRCVRAHKCPLDAVSSSTSPLLVPAASEGCVPVELSQKIRERTAGRRDLFFSLQHRIRYHRWHVLLLKVLPDEFVWLCVVCACVHCAVLLLVSLMLMLLCKEPEFGWARFPLLMLSARACAPRFSRLIYVPHFAWPALSHWYILYLSSAHCRSVYCYISIKLCIPTRMKANIGNKCDCGGHASRCPGQRKRSAILVDMEKQ